MDQNDIYDLPVGLSDKIHPFTVFKLIGVDSYKEQPLEKHITFKIINLYFYEFDLLSLTPLNLTKHYCRKCKNWSKSDYVIDAGPIQVRNRWPASVTGVAWHGCSRDSGGNHHF